MAWWTYEQPVHQRRACLGWRKCHVLGWYYVCSPYTTCPCQRCDDRCILHRQYSHTHCARLRWPYWHSLHSSGWQCSASQSWHCEQISWWQWYLQNRPHLLETLQALIDASMDEWANLSQDQLNTLVRSMPRRGIGCIGQRGGHITYWVCWKLVYFCNSKSDSTWCNRQVT